MEICVHIEYYELYIKYSFFLNFILLRRNNFNPQNFRIYSFLYIYSRVDKTLKMKYFLREKFYSISHITNLYL